MKKQLIAVGLAGLLTIPAVSFSAEMAGPSLYGSFRTGLTFGSGDATVADFVSRWGFKGSHEVAEGLTASYKYESKFNTTNAESSGGVGHGHPVVAGAAGAEAVEAVDEIFGTTILEFAVGADDNTFRLEGEDTDTTINPEDYVAGTMLDPNPDDPGNALLTVMNEITYATVTTTTPGENGAEDTVVKDYYEVASSRTTHGHNAVEAIAAGAAGADTAAITEDGGPGGRLSYVSLSGGFGSITLGQIWSASAIHYGFKVDPSYVNGSFGGANGRNANTVSYSSSASDVTFQIDKVTGDTPKVELGTSANLGPVGVSLGYWSNSDDDAGFTGVAVSSGAAGVNLTIGLGSSTDAWGAKSKTNILHIAGSVGDSGLSYGVQVANSDADGSVGDQNLLVVTNSLGSGASLIFEHLSPGVGDASSLLGLKVDF